MLKNSRTWSRISARCGPRKEPPDDNAQFPLVRACGFSMESSHPRSHPECGKGSNKLVDLLGQLQGMALQPSRSNHARQRRQTESEMDVSNADHAYRGDDTAGSRWRHVFHRTTEQRCCSGCGDGQAVLALPARTSLQD